MAEQSGIEVDINTAMQYAAAALCSINEDNQSKAELAMQIADAWQQYATTLHDITVGFRD